MKRNWMYLILIVLAGAAGAVLRGSSLLYGCEPETGLPVPGYLPATALIVLTVCTIVLFAVLSRMWFGKVDGCRFEQLFSGMGKMAGVLCAIAAIGMILFSALSVLQLPEHLLEQTVDLNGSLMYPSALIAAAVAVLWVLALCSGISLLLAAAAQLRGAEVNRRTGIYFTVPMFWCCLDLIMLYHENSGNPVTSQYSYALLLVIAVMTAFYSIGGFLFAAKGSAARFSASVGVALYLACVHVGGTAASCLMSGDGFYSQLGVTGTMRLAVYACTAVYLLVYLVHALRRVPGIKAAPEPAEQEQAE